MGLVYKVSSQTQSSGEAGLPGFIPVGDTNQYHSSYIGKHLAN